jgi:myo-inositol-1(or 4)-monophosphatase
MVKSNAYRSPVVKADRTYRPHLRKHQRREILTFAKGLARASGALALSFFGRANPALRYDRDLVTEEDLAVGKYINKEIMVTFPEHRFFGQVSQMPENDLSKPLWVVDPLDGSASFSAGMPIWGVSIALFDAFQPVLGVIHLPVAGEVYSAIMDEPAMLNDRQISICEQVMDNESLLLTYSRFHADYLTHLQGKVRSMGSTAAHLAYVARGAATCVVAGNNHIWDVAAGAVILKAAGGCICDLRGKEVDLADYLSIQRIDKTLIAAPVGLHGDIAALIEAR